MKSTLSVKLRLAFAVWIVGGFAGLVAMLEISTYFVVPLLLLMLAVAWYTLSLRCPHCNARVLITPVDFFGFNIPFVTSWVPRSCPVCRKDI